MFLFQWGILFSHQQYQYHIARVVWNRLWNISRECEGAFYVCMAANFANFGNI